MELNGRLVEDGVELVQTFHVGFMFVSFALAFLGGYTTVSLADQFRIAYVLKPKFMTQQMVLALMAVSVGGVAIWSMHFVGMGALVLKTPDGKTVKLYCDPALTVISLIAAVVFVYIGLYFSARGREYSKDKTRIFQMILKDAKKMSMDQAKSKFTLWKVALLKDFHNILIGGVITAAGVCVMHYIGMTAVSADATIEWNWGVVIASVLIACIAAIAAFWILFSALPLRPDMEILRVLAAVVAAIAVCGMHNTGMAAASFKYKYNSHDAILSTNVSMETASWGALVAGMGFLWLMTICILTDLRAWHLTLDAIVTKTDELMADMNAGTLAPRSVAHQYTLFRDKLVDRLPTNSNLNSSVIQDPSVCRPISTNVNTKGAYSDALTKVPELEECFEQDDLVDLSRKEKHQLMNTSSSIENSSVFSVNMSSIASTSSNTANMKSGSQNGSVADATAMVNSNYSDDTTNLATTIGWGRSRVAVDDMMV